MERHNPPIPFVEYLQGSLQPSTLLRIQGSVHVGAQCFAINLQCGPNTSPRDDIALHLSPVFTPPPRVVRNSLQALNWGPEESHGAYFPFSPGQNFEVLLLTEADHFKIAINGQHFSEFYYRVPLYRITHLAVDGNVSISYFKMEGTGRVPSPVPPVPVPYGAPDYSGGMAVPYPPSPSGAVPYPPQPVGASPYPMQPGGSPYPAQPGAGAYPMASGSSLYPSAQPYGMPSYGAAAVPGYPGQSAYYPHPKSPKMGKSSPIPIGGLTLGTGLAAGAAALAGGAMKSGILKQALGGHVAPNYGMNYGMGMGKAMGMGKPHGHGTGAGIGLGTGLAGAAALAGGAMLTKKVGKKMFKHKHKYKMKGWGGSSSSSSSSEEE